MNPTEVVARLHARLDPLPRGVRIELDEEDHAIIFLRLDMLHLDADALHDRLHHWTLRELHPFIPIASAFVSFRRALPADPHNESELDYQEGWLGLEPTLRLETSPPPTQETVDELAAHVPRFLQLVSAQGRPEGFRRLDAGNME